MPMINQTPESRFAGLLKPFFDSIGQARSPRPNPKGLLARQMNPQNPDAVAAAAPMITVCQEQTPASIQIDATWAAGRSLAQLLIDPGAQTQMATTRSVHALSQPDV